VIIPNAFITWYYSLHTFDKQSLACWLFVNSRIPNIHANARAMLSASFS